MKLYGKEAIAVGARLTARHFRYAKLVQELHTSFIEAIASRSEQVRKQKPSFTTAAQQPRAGAKREVEKVAVKIPSYEAEGTERFFREMLDIGNFIKTVEHKDRASEIQDFLKGTRVRQVRHQQEGTSWLELYTLYKLGGGSCVVADPECKAAPRPSMRMQLKAFTKTCRAIARLTMEQQDANLFKANGAKKPRLKTLGIQTHMPMVNFQLVIDKKTQEEIAKQIVRSQARRTLKQAEEIVGQAQRVKLGKFHAVNRTRWSRLIKVSKEVKEARSRDETERKRRKVDEGLHEEVTPQEDPQGITEEVEGEKQTEEGKANYFVCATCGTKVPSKRKAFDAKALDAKTWCGTCRKSWMVKNFNCECGRPWFKCSLHSDRSKPTSEAQGKVQQESQEKVFTKPGKARVKRATVSEDLEGFNARKRNRGQKTTPEPVFRATVLSEGLKRKFAHLCADE